MPQRRTAAKLHAMENDPIPMPAFPLLTADEVAEMLSLSPRYVRQLVTDGELEAVVTGRAVRFERSEIDRFVTAHRVIRRFGRRRAA